VALGDLPDFPLGLVGLAVEEKNIIKHNREQQWKHETDCQFN